jgi:hypothetical protein
MKNVLLIVLALMYLPQPKGCAHVEHNPPLNWPEKAEPSK